MAAGGCALTKVNDQVSGPVFAVSAAGDADALASCVERVLCTLTVDKRSPCISGLSESRATQSLRAEGSRVKPVTSSRVASASKPVTHTLSRNAARYQSQAIGVGLTGRHAALLKSAQNRLLAHDIRFQRLMLILQRRVQRCGRSGLHGQRGLQLAGLLFLTIQYPRQFGRSIGCVPDPGRRTQAADQYKQANHLQHGTGCEIALGGKQDGRTEINLLGHDRGSDGAGFRAQEHAGQRHAIGGMGSVNGR